MRRFPLLVLVFAAIFAAGCGNPNDLANASIQNLETADTLYALTGTPIATPSAYSIADGFHVRIDQGAAFDFAFNFDQSGSPVLLPLFVLGLGVSNGINAGFLEQTGTFESILVAPQNGYVTADTVHVEVGQRYVVRSRVVCASLGVPLYGKIEITAINMAARFIAFRVLTDQNCGYKGLEPGLPLQ
jgi:hypothetical protein